MAVKKLKIRESLNGFEKRIRDIKTDIRKIAAVDPDTTTYEDLKQLNFTVLNIQRDIEKSEKKGLSIEDCIDNIIDATMHGLKFLKDRNNEKVEYDKKVDALIPIIDTFLKDNYTVINVDKTGEGVFWTIEPPKRSNHDDCIAFVDSVVDAVNGKYYMTGRGSCWSSWHILSNGVELIAGWKSHTNNWEVEIDYLYHDYFKSL